MPFTDWYGRKRPNPGLESVAAELISLGVDHRKDHSPPRYENIVRGKAFQTAVEIVNLLGYGRTTAMVESLVSDAINNAQDFEWLTKKLLDIKRTDVEEFDFRPISLTAEQIHKELE